MKYTWERNDIVAGAKAKVGNINCVLIEFSRIGETYPFFAVINIATHQVYCDKDFLLNRDDMMEYLNKNEYIPDGRVISFRTS